MNCKARRLLKLAGLFCIFYKVVFCLSVFAAFSPSPYLGTVFGGRKRHFHLNFYGRDLSIKNNIYKRKPVPFMRYR